MNKNDDLNDRFMEELLREDARGREADEKLLAAVDAAMGGEEEVVNVTPLRRERSRAPYAWAAALTVSAAGVLGYMGWRGSEERMDVALLEPMSGRAVLEPAVHEAMFGDPAVLMNEAGQEVGSSQMQKKPTAPGVASPLIVADPYGDVESEGRLEAKRDELQGGLKKESDATPGNMPEPSKPAAPSSSMAQVVRGEEGASDAAARREVLVGEESVFGRAPSMPGQPEPLDDIGGGGAFRLDAPPVDRERYGQLVDQPWKTPQLANFSTFSVDVDTASYTNIRRMLQQGVAISPDAVRIEECINYFDYQYPAPTKGGPFAVLVDVATCPWAADHHLVKIGLKGMEVPEQQRPSSNLVFLIDVSGSMNDSAKLPLLVDAMKVLVEELDERDRVSMVVYAGAEGVVLNPTRINEEGRGQLLAALDKLSSGGSTNGGAGITRAYQLAQENFVEGGVNRVILATDGDFNVGTTGQGDLVKLVKERAQKGVFLSVLGFGSGNINDAMLEAITNDGNGNYFYIDSQKESRKVFLHDLSGTLVTIAKDVKIQVDFNPAKVAAYRLIGYANRILRDEDFNNDKVDAGDIGAGHTVTALYEIVPVGVALPPMGGVDASKYEVPVAKPGVQSPEWLTVKLRYKRPDGDKSTLLEVPVAEAPVAWEKAAGDFQFAAGVALFGMKLRQSEDANDAGWDLVRTLAKMGSARDLHGYRAEFLTLVDKAAGQERRRVIPMPENGIEAPPAE